MLIRYYVIYIKINENSFYISFFSHYFLKQQERKLIFEYDYDHCQSKKKQKKKKIIFFFLSDSSHYI